MCCAIFLVFAAAVFGAADADVLSSGKCNTGSISPVAVTYESNVNLINWVIIYVTDVDPFKSMDSFYVQMAANGDGTYNETDSIIYKDSSKGTHLYKQSYVKKVILQDTIDSTGALQHFHLYPLAVSKENAILYLRCSDLGGVMADTRFIAAPKGTKVSQESLKSLVDKDASYGFTGSLVKLPYSL